MELQNLQVFEELSTEIKLESTRKNLQCREEKIKVVEKFTGIISFYLTFDLGGKVFDPQQGTFKNFHVFEELSTVIINE